MSLGDDVFLLVVMVGSGNSDRVCLGLFGIGEGYEAALCLAGWEYGR